MPATNHPYIFEVEYKLSHGDDAFHRVSICYTPTQGKVQVSLIWIICQKFVQKIVGGCLSIEKKKEFKRMLKWMPEVDKKLLEWLAEMKLYLKMWDNILWVRLNLEINHSSKWRLSVFLSITKICKENEWISCQFWSKTIGRECWSQIEPCIIGFPRRSTYQGAPWFYLIYDLIEYSETEICFGIQVFRSKSLSSTKSTNINNFIIICHL